MFEYILFGLCGLFLIGPIIVWVIGMWKIANEESKK